MSWPDPKVTVILETVARPESPGLIRLKKHMGSGEGPTEAISYSFEEWKKQPVRSYKDSF